VAEKVVIGNAELWHGDCLDVLRTLPDCSVDSIVSDPPYGLTFMGKRWDYDVPSVEVWRECLRVLKPGGHLLAFAGTRTQHRMACRIEDAGFEIRDMIAWVYGSGFPKSLDVSKAIDKAAGAEREVLGPGRWNHVKGCNDLQSDCLIRPGGQHEETAPATPEAQQWAGWGTALKPALEPITVARKPLAGTVAANVLEHGTGALNVDGCRVGTETAGWNGLGETPRNVYMGGWSADGIARPTIGRWPANLIHDGSDEVVACFPDSNGSGAARTLKRGQRADGEGWGMADAAGELRDAGTGSAARFFYCAKASKADRNYGLDSIEIVSLQCSAWENVDQKARLRVDTAQSPPRVIDVSGAPCNDASAWNTFLFGNGTTDQCQSGSRFTIETATSSTTESKTLSWLLRSNTSEYTAGARSATVSGGSRAASAETTTPCLTTTSEWMVSPRGVERAASLTRWTINGNAGQPCDHPTVKPTDLMRYLCRLVTPPGGVVLDPFMGSGSTGKAAMLESFGFIGIEREAEYVEIAKARIARAQAQGQLLSPEEPRECVQEGLL
jgi:site-specific DNA-methyltransferase (adenine-specific)